MRARFAKRLTMLDWLVLTSALTGILLLSFPANATAAENKTQLVFEIKNFPRIRIPLDYTNGPVEDNQIEATPIKVEEPAVIVAASKPSKTFPPRVTGDARVYMHEPEIRNYICPKMGQKACDIFIAVLKAENGTHECTRDNRGLNKNGSVDVGLAQINWNPKWNPPYSFEQLQDCKFNLDIALKKYEARGFQPWYAYTKGAYLKFYKKTPAAEIAAVSIQ